MRPLIDGRSVVATYSSAWATWELSPGWSTSSARPSTRTSISSSYSVRAGTGRRYGTGESSFSEYVSGSVLQLSGTYSGMGGYVPGPYPAGSSTGAGSGL